MYNKIAACASSSRRAAYYNFANKQTNKIPSRRRSDSKEELFLFLSLCSLPSSPSPLSLPFSLSFHVRLSRLRRLFRLRSRRRTAAKNRPRTLDELITVFAFTFIFFSPLFLTLTLLFFPHSLSLVVVSAQSYYLAARRNGKGEEERRQPHM